LPPIARGAYPAYRRNYGGFQVADGASAKVILQAPVSALCFAGFRPLCRSVESRLKKISLSHNQIFAPTDWPCERGIHAARKSKSHTTSIVMKTIALIAIALITTFATPAARADYCRPYVTHTCVVDSRTECRWITDSCGRRYSYEITVVTYRSYYSNGETVTFTRSYRG
jgi:hypothetical protein